MEPKRNQNIILMRSAERIDNFVESWRSESARPWDPPLIPQGHSRAFSTGLNLPTQLGYPIHRVFVSPFLRCLETASAVISGLRVNNATNIKVSIQYGLCEAFNSPAIEAPPKDGEDWGFNLSEMETRVFPAGMVDPTCQQVITTLPQWGETKDEVNARYIHVMHALADNYPSENLLFITHGNALRGTLRTFLSNVKTCYVDYRGYLQLWREITFVNESFEAGKFKLLKDGSNRVTYTIDAEEDSLPIHPLNTKLKHYQNIILMRHAERIDNFDESWRSENARPWDPPLIPQGHSRAYSTGLNLPAQLDYPIHRVFASPFLRCVETASGVISGLCANNTSNIKVSLQYGLCEAFNSSAIEAPPKDGEDWGFNLSETETRVFPVGIVDPICEQAIKAFPQWGETKDEVNARYVHTMHALADNYPSENLLLITHGKALRGTLRRFLGNVKTCYADYCGYLHLRREITVVNGSFEAGKFELLIDSSNRVTYTTQNHAFM